MNTPAAQAQPAPEQAETARCPHCGGTSIRDRCNQCPDTNRACPWQSCTSCKAVIDPRSGYHRHPAHPRRATDLRCHTEKATP